MRTAKNYACHRVYDGAHHFLSQSVVSINEDGEVMDCKPLSQETAFTEWIGGVIILSPLSEAVAGTDFPTLLREMTIPDRTPLYAWHIPHFDFNREELAPQSIMKRL